MSVKNVTINFTPPADGEEMGSIRIAEFSTENTVDVWEGPVKARSVLELLGLQQFMGFTHAGKIDLKGNKKPTGRSPSPGTAA